MIIRMQLDDIDKALIALAQGDLDVTERPFDAWADRTGLSVDEVISRLRSLKDDGVIRDMKAVLRHRKAGFIANAMVVWAVPEDLVDIIGPRIAANKAVSHCYGRTGFGAYSVFSMIHGKTRDEILQTVQSISQGSGIDDFQIFWSIRELKKTSMKYFHQEDAGDE